jgi:hypothetical protein
MAGYIEDLERQLRHIDIGIAEAKDRLKGSEVTAKAKALDELVHLRLRHDDLVKRIADARDTGADKWSALHMSFQEEADGLRDTFENWLTRFGT